MKRRDLLKTAAKGAAAIIAEEASALLACTSGLKRSASPVADGRHSPIGMQTEKQPRAMKSTIRLNIALPTLLFLLATSGAIAAQSANAPKSGVKGFQVPFASLKPSATLKIGGTADWVLVTDDAVWVAGTKPYSVQHIDPITNRIVAKVALPGEACSGLAFGFGSLWIPVCGKKPSLVQVDVHENAVIATLPVPAVEAEGGITTSTDSVWLVTDKNGTLSRIDPSTNSVRQKVSIPPGSYNPIFSSGIVWVTGVERGVLTAVDASTGSVLDSVPVGSKPRFLTAGGSSIWTLNQGDGSVTRVDEKSRKVLASIQAGIPGTGGDIDYGAGSVWLSVFDVPLTRVEATTNRVLKQWIGKGGDSLRFGFASVWITDYKKGILSRIPIEEVR
jgi:virginiamycin B lyase